MLASDEAAVLVLARLVVLVWVEVAGMMVVAGKGRAEMVWKGRKRGRVWVVSGRRRVASWRIREGMVLERVLVSDVSVLCMGRSIRSERMAMKLSLKYDMTRGG